MGKRRLFSPKLLPDFQKGSDGIFIFLGGLFDVAYPLQIPILIAGAFKFIQILRDLSKGGKHLLKKLRVPLPLGPFGHHENIISPVHHPVHEGYLFDTLQKDRSHSPSNYIVFQHGVLYLEKLLGLLHVEISCVSGISPGSLQTLHQAGHGGKRIFKNLHIPQNLLGRLLTLGVTVGSAMLPHPNDGIPKKGDGTPSLLEKNLLFRKNKLPHPQHGLQGNPLHPGGHVHPGHFHHRKSFRIPCGFPKRKPAYPHHENHQNQDDPESQGQLQSKSHIFHTKPSPFFIVVTAFSRTPGTLSSGFSGIRSLSKNLEA